MGAVEDSNILKFACFLKAIQPTGLSIFYSKDGCQSRLTISMATYLITALKTYALQLMHKINKTENFNQTMHLA